MGFKLCQYVKNFLYDYELTWKHECSLCNLYTRACCYTYNSFFWSGKDLAALFLEVLTWKQSLIVAKEATT